jgi:maltooligosyltrehalose trehalohydrolase
MKMMKRRARTVAQRPEPRIHAGRPGATITAGGVRFRAWAPTSRRVDVIIEGPGGHAAHPLEPQDDGWFAGTVADAGAGTRYRLRLDDDAVYPDPLSRSQPDGVHGASEVIDAQAFEWSDAEWPGRSLEELVVYELHVGTATAEGTFDALIPRLRDIAELGATAIEVMPVCEFPGTRNWGYDGVCLFAPARAYGGADGLRRLVDAAHGHGLAVILDVVYNHFGPEGNYLHAVSGGRIFTERHQTPWGAAVNYDDASSAVRDIVLANVVEWIHDYRIDGLRLDAAHAIIDGSDTHILAEIAASAHAAADRPITVIAEDERNERTLLLPPPDGYGLDGVWADDMHHAMRRLLAGDRHGYYADYRGTTAEIETTLRQGWLHQGEPHEPGGSTRGTPSTGIPPQRFVHCLQNHDQVGNRALGERLHHQVDLAAYRAASALLLLTPYTPLLWMGQEWAASAPFLYFTDHPAELGRLVTKGRREEFGRFPAFSDPALRERIPDPQAQATFERSRLDWSERARQPHGGVLALYREMLRLRRDHPAMQHRAREAWAVKAVSDGAIALRRKGPDGELLLVANLAGSLATDLGGLDTDLGGHPGTAPGHGAWNIMLHTEQPRFGGSGGEPVLRDGRLEVGDACAVLLARGPGH